MGKIVLFFVIMASLQGCAYTHVSSDIPFLARGIASGVNMIPSLPCPGGEQVSNTDYFVMPPNGYYRGRVFYGESYFITDGCVYPYDY
jgi:hypothetical protein